MSPGAWRVTAYGLSIGLPRPGSTMSGVWQRALGAPILELCYRKNSTGGEWRTSELSTSARRASLPALTPAVQKKTVSPG